MINTYYFILLLVASGSIPTLADEEDGLEDEDGSPEEARNCYTRSREECPTDKFPDDFPKTADEILTICRDISELGRCLIRVREDCEGHEKEILAHIQTIVNYIDATCQTGNPTYEAIAGNLECIKEASNTSQKICRTDAYSAETKELVISHVVSFMEKALLLSKDNLHCVDRLFRIGCPSITVGIHCGSEAREAVYEVLKKTEFYGFQCEDEVMNEIEPLLDIFEEIIIERLGEENMIGDQKEKAS